MTPDKLYETLNGLRDEYRGKMNGAAEKALQFAQTEEMERVSEFSSESERNREAFHALNRAIKIVEVHFTKQ